MASWSLLLFLYVVTTTMDVSAAAQKYDRHNAFHSSRWKRAVGCLYGQLIGDSLGSRYEFKPAGIVQQMIQKDRQGRRRGVLSLLGGGPFHLRPGQVSDDSEMALSLASSLIRCGTFNTSDVACSYAYWAQTNPPDIGITSGHALNIERKLSHNWYEKLNDSDKKSIHQEILINVQKYNKDSLSNGCLKRISPLAIYSVNKPGENIKKLVWADCSLTHYLEDAKEATYAFVMAIQDLINGKSKEDAYRTALKVTKSKQIRRHLLTAQKRPRPVTIDNNTVVKDEQIEGMVYVGVALQSAFYELLHGTSFEKSVVAAISRGGDTDTNAAIVGALLGARFGVDRIPDQWIDTVMKSKPRSSFSTVDYNVERVVYNLLKRKKIG